MYLALSLSLVRNICVCYTQHSAILCYPQVDCDSNPQKGKCSRCLSRGLECVFTGYQPPRHMSTFGVGLMSWDSPDTTPLSSVEDGDGSVDSTARSNASSAGEAAWGLRTASMPDTHVVHLAEKSRGPRKNCDRCVQKKVRLSFQ